MKAVLLGLLAVGCVAAPPVDLPKLWESHFEKRMLDSSRTFLECIDQIHNAAKCNAEGAK